MLTLLIVSPDPTLYLCCQTKSLVPIRAQADAAVLCTRTKQDPPAQVKALIAEKGDERKLTDAQYCAAYLAFLCQNAISEASVSIVGKSLGEPLTFWLPSW